jgi:hypothetical protein
MARVSVVTRTVAAAAPSAQSNTHPARRGSGTGSPTWRGSYPPDAGATFAGGIGL